MKINLTALGKHFLKQCCHRRTGDMVSTVDKTGEDLVAWLKREVPKFVEEEMSEKQIKTELAHIFETGANEIRIYNLIKRIINKPLSPAELFGPINHANT